jgi:hypothetical protein
MLRKKRSMNRCGNRCGLIVLKGPLSGTPPAFLRAQTGLCAQTSVSVCARSASSLSPCAREERSSRPRRRWSFSSSAARAWRRVQSVREEGRDVSSQYGRRDETCPVSTGRSGGKGGRRGQRRFPFPHCGNSAPPPPSPHPPTLLPTSHPTVLPPPRAFHRFAIKGLRSGCVRLAKTSSRTKWTRLVPPPVLTGQTRSRLTTLAAARAHAGDAGRGRRGGLVRGEGRGVFD